MRAMKDSGVEWIGDVPKHWPLIRLQYCLEEINDTNNPVRTEQILSLMKDIGVIPYEDKGNVGNKAKADVSGYKLAYPDTIVANSMNVIIGSVGISKYFGCVSPVYYVLRATSRADLRFINYVFNTREFQKELRKYANGILEIRLRISSYDLFKRKIPLPSLDEQQRIADYLDERCGKIDAVKQTLTDEIEALQRLRKSTIHKAVTKGLDESVPMKDSGVEWIGEIPERWGVRRLKNCVYLRARLGWKALKAAEYQDDGYPMYSAFNIVNHKLDTSFANFITEERYRESPEIMLSVGDVLLVKDGAGYGKHAYVEMLNEPATVNSSIGVMTSLNGLQGKYLNYYLDTGVFEEQMELLITGMGVPHLTQHFLCNVYLPFPPYDEQQQIADYLDKRCAAIDSIIETRTKQLERLEDYRKALIFAYVTGKKEVPAHE